MKCLSCNNEIEIPEDYAIFPCPICGFHNVNSVEDNTFKLTHKDNFEGITIIRITHAYYQLNNNDKLDTLAQIQDWVDNQLAEIKGASNE